MDRKKIECWSIEDAEKIIHDYARGRREILELAYTEHAKARMEERDIIVSDILHVLARGYINEEPEESTRVRAIVSTRYVVNRPTQATEKYAWW